MTPLPPLSADGRARSQSDLSRTTLQRLQAVPAPDALEPAVLSAMHGLISANWTVAEVAAEFSEPTYPLTRAAAEVWQDATLVNVKRLHLAALDYRSNGAHAVRCRTARLTTADWWSGGTRQQNSEYLVLLGLYRIAEQVGSLAFTASARQVAEAAAVGGVSASGSSWQTAWHAAHRLAERGLIELSAGQRDYRGESTDTGSRFRLLSPERLKQSLSLYRLSTSSCSLWLLLERRYEDKLLDAALQHVCWEQRAGLGVACQRAWYALQHGELTAQQISDATGVSRQAIHNALTELRRYGLAAQPQRGVWACQSDLSTLDEAAKALGITERRALRQAGFKRYRDGRTNYVRLRQAQSDEIAQLVQYPSDWPRTDDGRAINPYTGEITNGGDMPIEIPAEPSRTVLDPDTGVEHVVTLTEEQIDSLAKTAAARFVALLGDSAPDVPPSPLRGPETATQALYPPAGGPETVSADPNERIAA